ncbi:MAG: serine/threonine-protein kinase [Gemmatimonadota bacterium]
MPKIAGQLTCANCGEPLFPDDQFCVGCGRSSTLVPGGTDSGGSTSNPTPVTNPNLMTRAATRALTQVGGDEVPCDGCQRLMGTEERFCAGCGQVRPGLELTPVGRGESKAEVAWREVQERLQQATLGRYEIVRELGRGGMAAVYLATETTLKRKVAIKVMRPSFLLDEGMVERFAREARTMASLHHPNIVTIHAVEEAGDLHFFVMQFISGRPLDELIRAEGQLPVAAVQAIMFQAASALSHAHRQGVIHRDIKPANIMLDGDGNAVVTDFGIAKVADVGNTSHTVGPMGTPVYMSPEQCTGALLGPASDQYSLGNVAYEMLTGVPPFQRASAMALGLAIMAEPPKPIREFRADCPPDVEAAVLKMLAKDPKARWANILEAVAAIGGDALHDDDPVREFLRAVAKKEVKPDARRLTPRAPRTSGFTGMSGSRGGRFRRALFVWGTIAWVGIAAGLYLFRHKLFPNGGAVAPAVAGASRPEQPTDTMTRTEVPPKDPNARPDPAAIIKNLETINRLISSAQVAMAEKRFDAAARTLSQALQLDPQNFAVKTMIGQLAAARAREAGATVAQAPAPGPPPATVPAAPTTTANPPPAPQPLPPPPPPPPESVKRPSHESEIRSLISSYVAAINARNIGQVKAIYPGITVTQEQQWKDRFAKDVKKLSASLAIRSVVENEDGTEAAATFEIPLTMEPEGASPISVKIRCDAVLKSEAGRWHIVSLAERGA